MHDHAHSYMHTQMAQTDRQAEEQGRGSETEWERKKERWNELVYRCEIMPK